MRNGAIAALAITMSLVARDAAAHAAACWARAVERLDHVMNPTEGGDNAFFTRAGGAPPMAMMLFANSPSMLHLPGFRPEDVPVAERGCARSSFLASRRWTAPEPLYAWSSATSSATSCTTEATTPAQDGQPYDDSFTYPRIDQGCYGGHSKAIVDDVVPGGFYRYRQWGDAGFGAAMSAADACATLPAAEHDACRSCLEGGAPYYIGTAVSAAAPDDMVVKGNFLHFHGPVYLNAIAAWKATIMDNSKIVWGHGYYDNVLPGMAKGRDPNPACNKFDVDFNDANRVSYVNAFSPLGPPVASIHRFPLAQALFSAGFFLTDPGRFANEADYVRTGANAWSPKIGVNQDTICSPCQTSATIVITDGLVSDDTSVHPDVKAMDVATPRDRTNIHGACTANADCGSGLRCVGAVCVDPTGLPCTGPAECGAGQQCVSGACSDEWWADDVAAYFRRKDVRTTKCGSGQSNPGNKQSCQPEFNSMLTYVVNVGAAGNPSLNSVARQGGTERAIDAGTAGDLRKAMRGIVQDILRRATSFSVAAITTVQTNAVSYAFVPRFRPSVLPRWEGHFFRFKLVNEFAGGCTPNDAAAPMNADKLSRNPNGDADCDDVYLKDRRNRFVGENSDGEFRVLDTTKAFPWPPTDTPAEPVWDAAERLRDRHLAGRARRIFTVVDQDGDGIHEPSERIEFSTANASALLPYLALGGPLSPGCARMALARGAYATELDCAEDLIRLLHGDDILDDDEDGVFDEPSPKMLLDIFHSSPILVGPPSARFLCDLGVSAQCVFSLYGAQLTPNGGPAYDAYAAAQATRDQFVLVASNAGMVHAFHAGTHRTGDDPETKLVEKDGTPYYDLGTGDELWAFVPPDLLPKVKRVVSEPLHQLLADGTAMVRDVWVDTSENPGRKDAGEFHTVAVFGERQGGRSWFGLDVTDPSEPKWLWGWPLPGTETALAAGESWNDLAPSAPPIVPIAVADDAGPLTVDGVRARERYVAFLNGGYDAGLARGRSVHALDVWTGEEIWRFSRYDAVSGEDPRAALFPVAATVAALDLGPGPAFGGVQDGLFDTAVVGDVGGQVWTFRFHRPAKDEGSDGLLDGWTGGRAFAQFEGAPIHKRNPFFQLAATTVLPGTGQVRAYVGSGDRQNIRDPGPGACNLSKLGGCLRRNCSVTVSAGDYDLGDDEAELAWSWSADANALPSTANTNGTSRSSACEDALDAETTVTLDCGAAQTWTWRAQCDWGASVPGVDCPAEDAKPTGLEDLLPAFSTENARFYAVSLFGAGDRAVFRTGAEAATYDGAALTDTDLVDADVTLASSFGPGFFVRYPAEAERTASGAGLLSGCVVWNTLTPDPNAGACGNGATGDQARLYRAHYATGSTLCGNSLGGTPPRSIARRAIVPPPTPTPVISLNPATGEVRYSVVSIEPGSPAAATALGQADLAGLVYWLEVPRTLHQCRHEAAECR